MKPLVAHTRFLRDQAPRSRGADHAPAAPSPTSALRLREAWLAYGDRVLWSGINMDVARGQFVTILGPNGSGKTSLLRAVLGITPLTQGTVEVNGRLVQRGNNRVGYIPQHRGYGTDVPMRARDLVRLGIDGHRWGLPMPNRAARVKVDELLAQVGATPYADAPLGQLSGGEQQRVRVAQALANDPTVLLCDEPLLSLDPNHQRTVVDLIDQRRRANGTAVLFVTHEINPVLAMTDLVLYVIDGGFRLGTVDEVLTTSTLSELYRAPVEVLRRGDRVVVVGGADSCGTVGGADSPGTHQGPRAAPERWSRP
jgi:zinc/manganese transport system ATP-binding protein